MAADKSSIFTWISVCCCIGGIIGFSFMLKIGMDAINGVNESDGSENESQCSVINQTVENCDGGKYFSYIVNSTKCGNKTLTSNDEQCQQQGKIYFYDSGDTEKCYINNCDDGTFAWRIRKDDNVPTDGLVMVVIGSIMLCICSVFGCVGCGVCIKKSLDEYASAWN
eukprot:276195_1